MYPSLTYEANLWEQGYRYIAGLDEAGRGAWAGPVIAAAVILPQKVPNLGCHLAGVRDSKMLSATQRDTMLTVIRDHAVAVGVGAVSSDEIDRVGIVPATRQAMTIALDSLNPRADYLLIDHLPLPDVLLPQHSLPKGDALVLSIAAASIVAKVTRDQLMIKAESQHPGYGFASHKGYGTAQHRTALTELGACEIHRFSFAPVAGMKERTPEHDE